MKEITVQVMEPSGIEHIGRAMLNPTTGVIYVTDGFARFLASLDVENAELWPTATIGAHTVPVLFRAVKEPSGNGLFILDPIVHSELTEGRCSVLSILGDWDRDQWQQFGRFSHTVCASALIGLIGYVHSVENWSAGKITAAAALASAAVILFFIGIYAVKGD